MKHLLTGRERSIQGEGEKDGGGGREGYRGRKRRIQGKGEKDT
jgi:hypothetical protein